VSTSNTRKAETINTGKETNPHSFRHQAPTQLPNTNLPHTHCVTVTP